MYKHTLGALLCFGLWGFFGKLSVLHILPKNAFYLQGIGVVVAMFIVWYFTALDGSYDTQGIFYGILTGIAYALGCYGFLVAAEKNSIAIVIMITALYPLITLILSMIFLKETFSIKQVMGMLMAVGAIYFMAN